MGADATVAALGDFYIKRFNLAGRDAEFSKNRVTLQRISRDASRLKDSGSSFDVTVRVADAWSDSPDFESGMKYYSQGKSFKWNVGTPYVQYGRVTFDGLLLNKSSASTIIDVKKTETEGVATNMLDSLEFQIWNDGSGARAQVGASGLGGTEAARQLTLTNAEQMYNLPQGTIFFGSTSGTGSGGTDHSDLYRVDYLDVQGNVLYATQITNTAGQELAASDYLYSVGSKGAYMPGIPTFISAAAPTDTLYGLARTGTGEATSGWRFPFVNSINETVKRSFSTMGRWVNRAAANFSVCLSASDWFLLEQEMEGKAVYDPQATVKFGTEAILVRTMFGMVPVIGIPQMVSGRGYIIDWSTWTLYTLGNLPHVINDDGKVMQRLAPGSPTGNNLNGDGVEMRYRIWKALLCDAPIANATFPTA